MIAEGIQNPTTGEIVKVQGAGTVYNEEKNSLALGKGTSAIGQDQLVFGRYNEEDADKAEIVGGGESVGETKCFRFKNYPEILLVASDFVKANGAEELDAIFSTIPRGTDVEYYPVAEQGIENPSAASRIPDGDLWVCTKLIDSQHDALHFLLITDTNPEEAVDGGYLSYIRFGTRYTNSPSKKWGILFNTNRYLPGMIDVISIPSPAEHKNIRTLDWDGTQWNAGDITCDDGEGNTISLRDLAAHKANVYETENIEALDGTVIEKLKAGDIIVKKGTNSNHAYRVSFKNATGMCLTYADAENVETIAYDKTDDTWAKTDKTVTGITGKADVDHNHDDAYAPIEHTHDSIQKIHKNSSNVADATASVKADYSSEDGPKISLRLSTKPGPLPATIKDAVLTMNNIDNLGGVLNGAAPVKKSLKITYNSSDSDFPISSAESDAINQFTDEVSENTWVPVRIELYEDSSKEGDVLGFVKWELTGQDDDEIEVTVMINNVKFFTSAQESSQTFTFTAWTKSFVGQSFFS